jgi:hypothetical protein
MENKKPSTESKKPKKNALKTAAKTTAEKEIGGFKDAGLEEPTRFGDWEVKGRCSDF